MISEAIKHARNFLFVRQHAYGVTFNGPQAEIVLRDLMRFCRGNQTTFHTDERMSLILQGRQEVWLRIAQHTNLDQETLWALYGGGDKPALKSVND